MPKITEGQGPTDKRSEVPVEEQIERNIADPRVPTKVRHGDGDGPATGGPLFDPEPPAEPEDAAAVADSPGGQREPGQPGVVVPEYNPGDYTVAEVNAYLEALSADGSEEAEAEYGRVIESERAGKTRSGILG